ncbi:LamG domain-containing protein [Larkinella rosea]|uniref:LamG domain-containing protein n=1 Tax=Larkinella rosea TaxID=2025312 RepID=A0A3P1BD53_9BACT|nr:LamG domain-containing protein [Larkinella rosea]RRA99040.1 LamG domain-containing protein [Larkinella rosea]
MKTRQISAWIAAVGLLASSAVFTSCSKDDDDTATLPPIGGFNSSNEVAASNLVAHWPFDGSNNERISSTAPESAVNAKFVTGASGQRQALDLASGYLVYPTIAAIGSANSLSSFTVSAWVNVKNRKGSAGSPATAFFSLSRPKEWAGSINLMAETGQYTAERDTLKVKGLLVQNGSQFEDSLNDPTKGGDQGFKGAGAWSHVAITYDGATSTFQVYANGKKISNPEWEKRGTTGNLNISTPAKAIIGAWATNLPGGTAEAWQVPMTGQIDEVRVYNKALSVGDIGSLYQLEQAGR